MEKVIKGLERCVEKLDTVVNKTHGFNCIACPYFRKCDRSGYLNGLSLMRDVLALLKAQEPVEYVVHCKNADLSNGTEFACGECGGSLLHKRVNYCPWCGRAVKWE